LTRAPELIEVTPAVYPPALVAEGLAGEAVLLIDIDATGEVERVEVTSATHPEFGRAAMEAALAFRFNPAEVDGVPAGIRIEYRTTFTAELPEPDAIAGEMPSLRPETLPENFRGLVREAGTRRPLGGASVTVGGIPVAQTDELGRFAVRGVALGPFHVRVAAAGFDAYEVDEEVGEGEALEVKYYLVRTSLSPYEAVVRTRADRREAAKVELSREEVRKIPGTFGDPVRVIENLPGLGRTPGGLGGALLVRGDRPASTAVFFDGVEVPLLYHFGGLTSVINAEFLESIDFYPGGFAARFGDATAGIVDVKSRDLDCEIWRGSGKVDFIDASAFTCAPVEGWQVAAAARRSYVDVLLGAVLSAMPEEEGQGSLTASPVYWDYQVKAERRLGAHRLDLFAFGADDRFELITSGSAEDLNVEVGLHLASHRLLLRHRWQPHERLSLTSQLAPGYLLQSLTQSVAELDFESEWKQDLWSVDWREELFWKPLEWLTLRAGLDHRFGSAGFRFELPLPTDVESFPSPTYDLTDTDRFEKDLGQANQGYWLELCAGPFGGVTLVPGVRLDRWDFHRSQKWSLSPRATVRWQVFEPSVAKAAYGMYERLPDPGFVLIDDIGNPGLPPERTHQFIAGWEQSFTELLSLDLQGFYNRRSNIPSFSQSMRYSDGTFAPVIWEADGSGYTYGMELLLRYLATTEGRFYGWIAYTLSQTRERDHPRGGVYTIERPDGTVEEIPYNPRQTREYPSQFDQTHILTVVAQWILPWGLEAGFRFRLVSGNTYTPRDQGIVFYDDDVDAYGVALREVRRNSERMPTFHQLDLRVDKTWTFDLWKLTLYLEVLNAYYHRNVESYRYSYDYSQRVAVNLYPILPNLGLRGEF
jgi:TonB family protein